MMTSLASLVGSQLWQLTILILIVGLLASTVFRNRPQLVHLLWAIVFVKSLTLPVWTSPTSIFNWIDPQVAADAADFGYLVPAPSPTPDETTLSQPLAASDALDAPRADESTVTQRRSESPAESAEHSISWWSVVWVVWLIGCVALLVLSVRRWWDVFRLVRDHSHVAYDELGTYANQLAADLGMKSPVQVVISRANLGPMVFGTRRPLLIIPEALAKTKTPAALRPIVAHELLHARRGDTTLGALQFVAQIVWWFHPLVWWASRQANLVTERCCDEEVISRFGFRPTEYAQCLLDTLELRACLSSTRPLPGIRSVDITRSRVSNIMKNSSRMRVSKAGHHWIYALALALLVLPGGGILIQAQDDDSATQQSIPELMAQAQQAVAAQEWDIASEVYGEVTERQPGNGRAWFMLGYSLHANGDLDDAIKAHQRAAEFPQAKPVALYNLACAHSLQGDRILALATLMRAIDAGFIGTTPIEDDTDFRSLLQDPEFKRLAKLTRPPGEREVYRQFDFWVGHWNVYGRNGQRVGTNKITKDEQGFLITEKWSNSSGNTGTSINYFDPSDQHWKQTWVDAGGNVVQYSGGFADGKMSLHGQLTKPNGLTLETRVSFTPNPDGSVRQHVEHSADEGQTWTTYFDGKYVRRSSGESTPASDAT